MGIKKWVNSNWDREERLRKKKQKVESEDEKDAQSSVVCLHLWASKRLQTSGTDNLRHGRKLWYKFSEPCSHIMLAKSCTCVAERSWQALKVFGNFLTSWSLTQPQGLYVHLVYSPTLTTSSKDIKLLISFPLAVILWQWHFILSHNAQHRYKSIIFKHC